ncbi:IS4 family transposase ISGur1 [bioreactor metagenome]|uniref:IS4 family transposase ISGur1 n=1 Tax=bioreactor metagenome TaxID=1076179 RepID=A0A645B3P1_9ZZZZ
MVTDFHSNDDILSTSFGSFAKKFNVFSILAKCGAKKLRGVSVSVVFAYLFSIAFKHTTVNRDQKGRKNPQAVGKDCVHRFLQSPKIDWNRFTALLAAAVIRLEFEPLYGKSSEKVADRRCLVIDDSSFKRSRSKKVELLATCFDHAHHVFYRGFRMLTLGYTDGQSFLPVAQCAMSTENEKMRINDASEVEQGTPGHTRRQMAQKKATESMLDLIDCAKDAGLEASYVLFDSWFSAPAQVTAILEKGYDVVCMVKKGNTKYACADGLKRDVSQIFRSSKKRRGLSKYLLSQVVSIMDGQGREREVKLVFVRSRSNRKDFLVLLSTDIALDEQEIVALYGNRWSIEVFFKNCKSQLRLEKGNQSLNYDEISAHIALVFTQYMMLSYLRRLNTDERSIGELFLAMVEEMKDTAFDNAMELILYLFIDKVAQAEPQLQQRLYELADLFISTLPDLMRDQLRRAS